LSRTRFRTHQAGGAMLLIFVGAVANFPEPMDEDGARQAVA
jgi:hypothetical protein